VCYFLSPQAYPPCSRGRTRPETNAGNDTGQGKHGVLPRKAMPVMTQQPLRFKVIGGASQRSSPW